MREAWDNEATSFTPWLAEEGNLAVLSETLEMDLGVVGVETNVGSFRADIVCRDQSYDHSDDQLVLIENQLERTDHTHLGQLLTYAAGLQTVTLVWIADKFTEPHRAALDWLNEITDERFRFFGLEVELWRIGDSPLAPKFNIVSKPNSWSKTVHGVRRDAEASGLTDIRQAQLSFWNELSGRLDGLRNGTQGRIPRAQQWYPVAIGRSGFVLNAYFVAQKGRIGVDLFFSSSHAHMNFDFLSEQKDDIERELGKLEWIKAAKEARIAQYLDVEDMLNQENWQSMLDWLVERLIAFDRVFRARIREIPNMK
ncbi:MAG: DUF4268 domain-containing protein [Sphingomonadales bacterium]|nr:DUF4268 domain-containing protein [Sphingomonadales bacterium]